MDTTSLPFEAFPARQRRPVIGALLVAAAYVLPIGLIIGVGGYEIVSFFSLGKKPTLLGEVLQAAVFLALIFAARLIYKIGAALRQPDAIELLKSDQRPPILYLRSFDDDSVPDLTPSLLPIGPKQTIEMRLDQVLEAVGPVISIGRPGERLPEIGTKRFYVSDDDWQQAVLTFLERAAAVIILVGRSTGVAWEIETVLRTVPFRKILLVFPYLLPKEKRTTGRTIKETIRLRPKGDDSVSKKMIAELREEHDARYRSFCENFGDTLPPNMPACLDGGFFLDFVVDNKPRAIPMHQPLFIRRRRDRQGITLDYRRTLRPFLEKLQGRTIEPGWVERFFTHKFTLGAFAAACLIVTGVCFYSGYKLSGTSGLFIFFFLGVFALNLAAYGIWNLFRLFRPHGNVSGVVSCENTSAVEGTATAQPASSVIKTTHVVYTLLALSLIFGFPVIIAAIIHYLKRRMAHGTYLESHFRWQIRTIGFALLWFVVAMALAFTGFGLLFVIPIGLGVYIWVASRITRGWRALKNRQPILKQS